jgi:hypothetical protein
MAVPDAALPNGPAVPHARLCRAESDGLSSEQ